MPGAARLALAAWIALGAASARAAEPEIAPAAPGEGEGAAPAPAAPDLRVRPRIATLPDLRPFAGADPAVGERLDRLRTRRNVAVAAFGGAIVSGIVGAVVTMVRTADEVGEPCPSVAAGGECRIGPDYGPTLVAGGVSLVLAGLGFAVLPKRSDVAETVALWNARHPEAPLELEQP